MYAIELVPHKANQYVMMLNEYHVEYNDPT